ncbi:hypothetical protein ZIOFF_055542 [Zingiber officinale]|uniref:Nucleoside phosphorylase domain-containing protein n=1 Tax=Zingiber officinale TaxID=94328 RepID=A0A8J5FGL3_ZINOF|nr:hypothetical protein ZIOFF_055542 [Zingiber officinale]
MAPPEETEAAAAAIEEENLAVKPGGDRPISTILIVIAMQTEALPLVAKFELSEDLDRSAFPKGVPWVRYHGTYKGLDINLVWPGKDTILGETQEPSNCFCQVNGSNLAFEAQSVDSVGTVSASLLTYASIQALKPDLIINAGTAGGFQARGACIKDVYLVSDVAFHDRRIPIPVSIHATVVFDLYGIGTKRAFSTPYLVKELGLKVGKLSTGDSLDMCPQDESSIIANDATVKDMEGAAVAYVAGLFSIPAIFLKAVTDIVDGPKPTAEEFMENLIAVSAALHQAVTEVVDFISGKSLSDL